MTNTYKIGFPDGTPVGAAKEQALDIVRQADGGPVTAGPAVVQAGPHRDAGEYLIRVVTGGEDPAVAARARADAAARSQGDAVYARLAELPPEKIAALGALLDKL